MDADALIVAFRRLRTHDSRREAINALLHELTPYEWRELHSITAARTFQFDIIGQLPVELVALVFAYLPTSSPYRLQRVSRQWRHTLQSPDVLKSSLASWYGGALKLQNLDYSLCERKARHIQPFRHGDPYCSFKIDLTDLHGHVTLVDDTLVWSGVSKLDQTARAIYVFDISTWRVQTLAGDARERVERIFASDKLVGFATSGTVCYVWSLDSREKRRFRVPNSALFQSITCRGNTVACAACLDNHVLVYIWDYDTQQGRSFTISYDSPLLSYPQLQCEHRHGLALLLQPENETIIVVADDRLPFTRLRYSRFRYTGECVAESELTLQFTPASIDMLDDQFRPTDNEGTFRLTIASHVCLQFDEKQFKFTELEPLAYRGDVVISDSMYWWKDIYFKFYEPDEGTPADSLLVYVGTSDNPQEKPLTTRQYRMRRPRGYGAPFMHSRERVYLNDRYVVHARMDRLEVVCFDESVKLVGRSGPFFDIGSWEVTEEIY